MTNAERNRNRWDREANSTDRRIAKLEHELRVLRAKRAHAHDKYVEWAIKASEEKED